MRGVFGLYGHNLPKIVPGSRSVPAALHNVVVESVERVRPVAGVGSGLQLTQIPGGIAARVVLPQTYYIRLTAGAGADGGYPYKIAYGLPPIRVTAAGSGYLTTAPTAAITGGGGSGATAVATIAGGVVTGVRLTAIGSNYVSKPTLALTGGDGTGAAAEFTDPQWEDSGLTFPGPDELAYEGRLVRELPASDVVYPAARDPLTGRLLFFCSGKMVAITATVTSYPTSAGVFYGCHPVGVTGTPSEGSSGSFSSYTANTFYALNLGGTVPASGTYVVASWAGRWVFRYG